MRIKHRYGFSSGNRQVMRFLKRYGIAFQQDELIGTTVIFEDDDVFTAVRAFFEKKDVVDVVDAVYDKSELETADWLTIKSEWWSQYPEPKESMGYMFTTYDASAYCPGIDGKYRCGKGLVQKQPFVIKKCPNWGSRNFMMLNWVPDELFVSTKAAAILAESKLKGFSFLDVLDPSQRPYDSVKQLKVKNHLPKSLAQESVKERFVCPACGFEKFLTTVGPMKFYKSAFADIDCDIVKTEDAFGEIGCNSMILVSHSFYAAIVKNKIGKGLIFEPIEIV